MDNKLLGVVLCGGESRRMGRDKGLLLKDGIPWARHMADKLNPWQIPVVYSIHPNQTAAYIAANPSAQLIPDSPGLAAVAGPLRGLLSVHERFPDKDLLLLACDMPEMDEGTIRALIGSYGSHTEDFYAYRDGDFLQPFCAIYTAAGLAGPHTTALEGIPCAISLQALLTGGRTWRLVISRPEAFSNFNTL